jgi:hypothetical protein
MFYFPSRTSATLLKSFVSLFAYFSGVLLVAAILASNADAQISGATQGEPVIATGPSSGTSDLLYLDATQFSSIQAAINSTTCPSNGCGVDARAIAGSIGSIDPMNKAVTILFGPHTYSVGTITLRSNLHIYGAGSSATTTLAVPSATVFQASSASTIPFQLGSGPVLGVDLEGFRVYGAGSGTGPFNSTTPAFNLTASGSPGGCWYCTFRDITVFYFTGGTQGVWTFVGSAANGGTNTNQWIVMEKIINFRQPSGSYGLYMAGQNGQVYFTDCEFDGQASNDGTNIYIGIVPGSGNNDVPYSLSFRGLTSQNAALAVNINGAWHIRFEQSHHEALNTGAYNITNTATPSNVGSYGIVIDSSFFAGNVGAPSGYDVNIATTVADLIFTHNYISGTPGSVISGTNLASVTYADNSYNNNTFSNVSPVTSGITPQMTPATTLNIGRSHVVLLNSSSTSIQTLVSQLGPGEIVTFISNVGFPGSTFQFETGGNINIGSSASPLVVKSPDTVTFMRSDLSETWNLIGKSF